MRASASKITLYPTKYEVGIPEFFKIALNTKVHSFNKAQTVHKSL